MTKIYKRRKLHGLKSSPPAFVAIDGRDGGPLSQGLCALTEPGSPQKMAGMDRLFVVGALNKMTREYMSEPLRYGWKVAGEFAFKHRTAVYERDGKEIPVKLISHRESWLPGCEDIDTAMAAWRALESEWKSTGLPLLSSPAATGKALLWESFPRDVEFPALPDDLARLIRANSPQHRIETFLTGCLAKVAQNMNDFARPLIQYDGRWMYAAMCGLDRFPVGELKRVGHFTPYTPGWYNVKIRVPDTWNHIGLIPVKGDGGAWWYPALPGRMFEAWVCEPELTFATEGIKKLGLPAWEIVDFYDAYASVVEKDGELIPRKGRPLLGWSQKLIEMRASLQWTEAQYAEEGAFPGAAKWPYKFAAAAVRQILNHTIGSIHKNEFQRERFVSDDNYRLWRRENPHLAEGDDVLRVDGGYMVPTFVPDNSPLSIFMPHVSGTLYSLARARVAEWALRCDPRTLVKIHGDAIYSTVEQPELDKLDDGKTLGRPRRK